MSFTQGIRKPRSGLVYLLLGCSYAGCGFFPPKNSELDINEDNVSIAFVALDEDAENQGFTFPDTTIGSEVTQTITLQNYGNLKAQDFSVIADPNSTEFTFLGGTYPGTGGTCTDSLKADETCTVVIAFSSATAGTYSAAFTLSYFNGLNTMSESLTLSVNATETTP
jgi:hypothetical protein